MIMILILITIIDIDATIQGQTITFFDDFLNKPNKIRIAAIISPLNAVLSVMYVYLLTQGRGSSYIYGLLSSGLYAYIAFALDYIGDFVISLIYLPLFIYGFYKWFKKESFSIDKLKQNKAKSLNPLQYVIIVHVITILVIIWLFLLPEISNAMIGYYAYKNSPGQWGIDSITNALNLVGMSLMIFGYRNQYDIWFLVNVLSIVMYIWIMINGQYFALSLVLVFFIYFIATIYGIKSWYFGKLEEKVSVNIKPLYHYF